MVRAPTHRTHPLTTAVKLLNDGAENTDEKLTSSSANDHALDSNSYLPSLRLGHARPRHSQQRGHFFSELAKSSAMSPRPKQLVLASVASSAFRTRAPTRQASTLAVTSKYSAPHEGDQPKTCQEADAEPIGGVPGGTAPHTIVCIHTIARCTETLSGPRLDASSRLRPAGSRPIPNLCRARSEARAVIIFLWDALY
jgi:hypothetical protein